MDKILQFLVNAVAANHLKLNKINELLVTGTGSVIGT
jgi:hypothetical protein